MVHICFRFVPGDLYLDLGQVNVELGLLVLFEPL